MSLLTKADLKTHVYAEIIDAITRSDDTIVDAAINKGESEAKAYLNRYNLATMFAPEFADEFLRSNVKDIVCWHLIKLANPNIDIALFRTSYEDAIRVFDKVNKGIIQPAWPLVADDPATPNDDAGTVEFRSQCKRNNYY